MTRYLFLGALALGFFCTVARATISGGSSTPSTISESTLAPIATGNLLGNVSGSSAPPTTIPLASSTGDLNISSAGVVTVTGIQGMAVSPPTGTGAAVLATSPTLNTATLGSGSMLTDTINQGYTASTVATTYTSNTTLGTISGLVVNVTTGGTYDCFGHLSVIADSAGGIKVTVNGTGLSVSSASFTFTNWNGAAVNAKGTITALGTAAAAATATASDIDIQGVVVLTTGGTLYPQAAENTSDATATTINKNSYFACQRVN